MIINSESPRETTEDIRRGVPGKHAWGPILVGTDGSGGAVRAVDAAIMLAAELNVDIWIVNVIGSSSENVLTQIAREENASIGDVAEAMAARVLTDASVRADAGGVKKIHTVMRAGDDAEEIIAAARESGASAIFVGRRGTGGRLSRALLGSVSQKLAGISPIMLVIVP